MFPGLVYLCSQIRDSQLVRDLGGQVQPINPNVPSERMYRFYLPSRFLGLL